MSENKSGEMEGWIKSTYSGADGCVEVALLGKGVVGFRDSKLGNDSPVPSVSADRWRMFREAVKQSKDPREITDSASGISIIPQANEGAPTTYAMTEASSQESIILNVNELSALVGGIVMNDELRMEAGG